MWIHLKNDKERATLNMNVAVFFGLHGLQHKEALKQIINFYGCSVEEVSTWFETSIEEFNNKEVEYSGSYTGIPRLSELMRNYEYFKKTYLPKEKLSYVEKKINSYKSKFGFMNTLDKLVIQQDRNTVIMADSLIFFIYHSIEEISVKENYGTGDLSYFKNLSSEIIVDSTKGESRGTMSFNELKNIACTGYIQIGNSYFDVAPVIKLLDKKEIIDVTYNDNIGRWSRKALIFTQNNFIESTTVILNPRKIQISEDTIIY